MSTPKHNPGTPAEQARVRQSILHSTFDALTQRTDGLKNFPVFLEECFENRIWEKERSFATGRACAPTSFHEFVHAHFPVGLGSSYEAIEEIIEGNPKLIAAWEGFSGRKRPSWTAARHPDMALMDLEDDIERHMLAWEWPSALFVATLETWVRRARDHFETKGGAS